MALLVLMLAAGCSHPQTLRFEEDMAIMVGTRAQTEFRYHKRTGWNMPEAPGTPEAEARELATGDVGGGILFRFIGDLSFRHIEDDDEVRTGEWAAVDDTVFSAGTVTGTFDVTRQNLHLLFGFFTDRFLFGGGFGTFLTGFQIRGDVRNATERASVMNKNSGAGLEFYLEGSPNYPPVRLYVSWRAWWAYDGSGYFRGETTELGVRAQFRGFMIYGGYRMEEFSGRLEHSVLTQSRLKFDVNGPFFGVGVSF
jgi:hypothetical protein